MLVNCHEANLGNCQCQLTYVLSIEAILNTARSRSIDIRARD
jgi:hypothetical protein